MFLNAPLTEQNFQQCKKPAESSFWKQLQVISHLISFVPFLFFFFRDQLSYCFPVSIINTGVKLANMNLYKIRQQALIPL